MICGVRIAMKSKRRVPLGTPQYPSTHGQRILYVGGELSRLISEAAPVTEEGAYHRVRLIQVS
jgi:hypothetical protein